LAVTAEEVTNKDDQHPPRDMLPGVQTPEAVCLTILIEDLVVVDLADEFQRRQLVVDVGQFILPAVGSVTGTGTS